VQRQKLHVARALLKRGDFIILNKALSSVEQRTQEQLVRSVLNEAWARRPQAGGHLGTEQSQPGAAFSTGWWFSMRGHSRGR